VKERSRSEALAEVNPRLAAPGRLRRNRQGLGGWAVFRRRPRSAFSVENCAESSGDTKFPFAGALKAVGVDGSEPLSHRPAVSENWHKSRADQFDRRFEAIKNRLAEVLARVRQSRGCQRAGGANTPPGPGMRIMTFRLA